MQTVQTFLNALDQRDLEKMVGLFAQEVDWFIPGDEQRAPWLGRRSDKNDVRDFFSLLWPATQPRSADVEHLFVEGDKAVIIGVSTPGCCLLVRWLIPCFISI
ncbi:MAG TPA: nuclear transport factor 2 family protein [Pedobacter sp.]|nr:nuclear transport factor 2 family protein [Pedobacter sp.]